MIFCLLQVNHKVQILFVVFHEKQFKEETTNARSCLGGTGTILCVCVCVVCVAYNMQSTSNLYIICIVS